MDKKFRIRNLKRVRVFKNLEKISDKVIVYKSKTAFAQYLILPGFFTFISLSYFRRNNFESKYLFIMILGFIISLIVNIIITKIILNKPEIIIDSTGITFRNTETIFWKEMLYFHVSQRNSSFQIYIKTNSDEFFLTLKDLSIRKIKLKILMNSFYRKYAKRKNENYKFLAKNMKEIEIVNFDKYLNNKIL